MGEQKRKEATKSDFIFGKKNYKFMLIGLAIIILGFILMSGGGSDDPNVWNPDVFSSATGGNDRNKWSEGIRSL